MKIYIGADHNGFEFKNQITDFLSRGGYEVIDEGDTQLDPNDDYPQFAGRLVAGLLASEDKDAKGILICGSGQGMCIAANRFKGIRASLCWDQTEARAARNDDDSNVLCLSSRYTSLREAEEITMTWLSTAFAGADRYKRRIKELDEL
ncbi:MAG TPA: RpiB/LacA/LacB family sugar-phosphate isomerase [Candidatus Saccharimonadales bacterium]|nr:RpiB/LacA/LacB family sugar-phosphate isomerase [Candidatus Saccharimonadales bacterium]